MGVGAGKGEGSGGGGIPRYPLLFRNLPDPSNSIYFAPDTKGCLEAKNYVVPQADIGIKMSSEHKRAMLLKRRTES